MNVFGNQIFQGRHMWNGCIMCGFTLKFGERKSLFSQTRLINSGGHGGSVIRRKSCQKQCTHERRWVGCPATWQSPLIMGIALLSLWLSPGLVWTDPEFFRLYCGGWTLVGARRCGVSGTWKKSIKSTPCLAPLDRTTSRCLVTHQHKSIPLRPAKSLPSHE